MKQIQVSASSPYSIYFCDNVFNEIKSGCGSEIFLITDENVDRYYHPDFKHKYVIRPGEESKSFSAYEALAEKLLEDGVQRGDTIAAFGGGVVGDLAGFLAATLLRGVDFIQIPTSLLAMTDSSIGGKTALNTNAGKNLIGAFYQPKAVYIDINYLQTLPQKYFNDGMGEVIKYAFIKDKNLLDLPLWKMIFRCCKCKAEIISEDEKDTGIRKILNFGHTVGHALEKYYNYSVYTHGEAVSVGMYQSAVISERLGYAENISQKLKKILTENNLPYELGVNPKELKPFIKKDKKANGEFIDFVFLSEMGSAFTEKITCDEIVSLLEK